MSTSRSKGYAHHISVLEVPAVAVSDDITATNFHSVPSKPASRASPNDFAPVSRGMHDSIQFQVPLLYYECSYLGCPHLIIPNAQRTDTPADPPRTPYPTSEHHPTQGTRSERLHRYSAIDNFFRIPCFKPSPAVDANRTLAIIISGDVMAVMRPRSCNAGAGGICGWVGNLCW